MLGHESIQQIQSVTAANCYAPKPYDAHVLISYHTILHLQLRCSSVVPCPNAAMTTSARAVLMGSSNGGTPPLAESKANGARRPVESAGGARLPLPPSTPAQGAAPPPQSRTASGKSALKQRPVWGGNGASSSKRVMYEVPSGVKPKPMLRPATHHGSAAAGAGASAGKQSAAGSGGSSRRWRSNYIPDGECRCKDYHLPHKHIVSPVDEAVKLGTLLATLRVWLPPPPSPSPQSPTYTHIYICTGTAAGCRQR